MSEALTRISARLRQGKATLREQRRSMTLAEKVQQVIELQAAVLPLIRQQRAPRSWERVWDVEATTRR